jgi:hypothetical protein
MSESTPINTSDPHENWKRLIATQVYLRTYFAGRALPPDRQWYNTHNFLIKDYLKVVLHTSECNQEVVPYFDQLLDEYRVNGYFDLKVYLQASDLLIGTKEEYDLQLTLGDLSL